MRRIPTATSDDELADMAERGELAPIGEPSGPVRFESAEEVARGSSPRVRGKRPACPGGRALRGLIPARAGKTPRDHQRRRNHRAHPRACGENGPWFRLGARGRGSSPRVRGKLWAADRPPGSWGLIPARAGKTPRAAASSTRPRAHPRACGENGLSAEAMGRPSGSSPRVRGKPSNDVCGVLRGRLIPARAGKTGGHSDSHEAGRAHPRACGENATTRRAASRAVGSSPRVRGKQGVRLLVSSTRGLIPARAGKTKRVCVSSATGSAHPRACGENELGFTFEDSVSGSSPRVRGKHGHRHGHQLDWRLIPARAGKTLRRRASAS